MLAGAARVFKIKDQLSAGEQFPLCCLSSPDNRDTILQLQKSIGSWVPASFRRAELDI
jgi:hypothetical protein